MGSLAWQGVERRSRPDERPTPQPPPTERATPGVIRLRAVHDQGLVVDFILEYADAAAAQQLGFAPTETGAERPLDSMARVLGDPYLFMRYSRVVVSGEAQAFVHTLRNSDPEEVANPPDQVLHRVVRKGDGVSVTLTNLSANRRHQARRLGNRVPGATPSVTGS